jgi:hypothetical protein
MSLVDTARTLPRSRPNVRHLQGKRTLGRAARPPSCPPGGCRPFPAGSIFGAAAVAVVMRLLARAGSRPLGRWRHPEPRRPLAPAVSALPNIIRRPAALAPRSRAELRVDRGGAERSMSIDWYQVADVVIRGAGGLFAHCLCFLADPCIGGAMDQWRAEAAPNQGQRYQRRKGCCWSSAGRYRQSR